jgi:5-(carboxyamino)imidazole ribonucleotide synthase
VRPIPPGAAIGVLGSGQLGRMFAIAARRMGYRVHTFSPDTDTPTGQVADVEIVAPYEDLDAVRRWASQVRAVTFEFENVPFETAAACAECTIVRPRGEVLHTTQNRLREKHFLQKAGLPLAPFREVRSLPCLVQALEEIRL